MHKFILQIKDDLQAILHAEGRVANARNIAWAIFGIDAFIILLLFRTRKLARTWHIPFVNRVLRGLTQSLYGIELGIDVELGTGVYFVHSLGTVVGGKSKVGARTKFYGCNTVGTAKQDGEPVIGEDVSIGAGARILGPIVIAAGTSIGANAVVMRSNDVKCTLVGIPAKPTRQNSQIVP